MSDPEPLSERASDLQLRLLESIERGKGVRLTVSDCELVSAAFDFYVAQVRMFEERSGDPGMIGERMKA